MMLMHSPLVISAHARSGHVALGASMLRNCTTARYALNKSRMVRLAEYSRDCLRELRAETGIPVRQTPPGYAAVVPHPTTARPRTSKSSRRSLRAARPRWRACASAGAGRVGKPSAPCACQGDETGDCHDFHPAAGRDGQGARRVLFVLACRSRASSATAPPHHRHPAAPLSSRPDSACCCARLASASGTPCKVLDHVVRSRMPTCARIHHHR